MAEHPFIDLPVGEILRRARVEKNLSIEQAEFYLRIKKQTLLAIEGSDYERLPGRIYVIGFVRSYAEFLDLDGDKVVELLKLQARGYVQKPEIVFPEMVEDTILPDKRIILASVIGALLLIITIIALNSGGGSSEGVPSVPLALKNQLTPPPQPQKQELAQADKGAEVEKPASAHPIVLKAVQDVWLEIRDSARQTVFSRVLREGEEYWVPEAQTGLSMTTGNAGGLKIVLDGKELPVLGRMGEVKRNLPLEKTALLSIIPADISKTLPPEKAVLTTQ